MLIGAICEGIDGVNCIVWVGVFLMDGAAHCGVLVWQATRASRNGIRSVKIMVQSAG